MNLTLELPTLEATKELAKALSSISQANMILLINGPLGAGKTQLTKLIGQFLNVRETITSPSFVILNQYKTNKPWHLIHIDAYRLNQKTDFNEYFELMDNNFTIIEWANNIHFNFDKLKTITINFTLYNNQREVTIVTNNITKEEEKLIQNLK